MAAVSAYVAFANCGVFNVIFHWAGDLPENMGNYKREIRRLGKMEMAVSANSTEFKKIHGTPFEVREGVWNFFGRILLL